LTFGSLEALGDQVFEDGLLVVAGDVEGLEQVGVVFVQHVRPVVLIFDLVGGTLILDQVVDEAFEDISLEPLAVEVPDVAHLEEGCGGGGRSDLLGRRRRGFLLVLDQVAVHPSHQRLVVVNVPVDGVGGILQALAHAVQLVEPLDAGESGVEELTEDAAELANL